MWIHYKTIENFVYFVIELLMINGLLVMIINTMQPCILYTTSVQCHTPNTQSLSTTAAIFSSQLPFSANNQLALWGREGVEAFGPIIESERKVDFIFWRYSGIFWGQAVCCQVHRWRCAMWVYQNNRWPPAEMFSKQIFHSQRSISPAFMGQEAKKHLNWLRLCVL